jgi:hypothetical protein
MDDSRIAGQSTSKDSALPLGFTLAIKFPASPAVPAVLADELITTIEELGIDHRNMPYWVMDFATEVMERHRAAGTVENAVRLFDAVVSTSRVEFFPTDQRGLHLPALIALGRVLEVAVEGRCHLELG